MSVEGPDNLELREPSRRPGARSGLGSRLSLLLSPAFQRSLLGVAVSGFLSFLLIDYVRLPTVELKVGDIAEHNVRANQNFEFTDRDATARRRDEAERSVRPVFDLDSGAAKSVTTAVRKAFSTMREHGATRDDGEKGATTSEGARAAVPSAPEAAKAAGPPATSEPADGYLELSSPERRREFFELLGGDVLDVFYQNLVYTRFDPALENAICTVVETVLKPPVISDRNALPEDAGAAGITVVRVNDPVKEERSFFGIDQVLDLTEARLRAVQLSNELFADRPQFHRDTIAAFAHRLIRPTLSYNASVTSLRRQQARTNVQPVTYQVKKGTMIVRTGDPIDAQKLLFLQGIAQAKADYHPLRMFGSVALLVLLLLGASYVFASSYIRKFSTSMKDLATASVLLVFVVALTRVAVEVSNALAAYIPWISIGSYYYAIPVACGAMVVRLLMNSETALLFSLICSSLVAMLLDYNLFYLAYFFIGSIAAAGGMAHTKERVHVLRGGLVSAAVSVLGVLAIHFVQQSSVDNRLTAGSGNLSADLTFAVIGGIGAAILTLGVLPFFEMFGYITDHKLLELANMNHPLLKEMMVRAPGTYHHSVIVGTLSEAAAQAIKANALLARVGCYYHDIGKMKKPEYFIENLRNVAENRHDRLEPHMSALIIASHVRDGIEMGRQHRLPEAILDLIPQHHGTALISFFYNKAKQSATDADEIDENDFRYPGPKPQTREAGIVMLADATEASTRSIKQINSAKIRINLQKIFQRVINDGQLDECPLTLKDLAIIAESFHRTLLGIYHSRIEYPPEFRGASVAGEGTGAVITLDQEGAVAAAPRPAGGARPGRPEDLSAATTAEIVLATVAAAPVEPPQPAAEEPRVLNEEVPARG